MLAGTPISGSGSPRMAGSGTAAAALLSPRAHALSPRMAPGSPLTSMNTVMQQQPSQQRPNPFGPGLGHDPARLAPVAKPMSNAITNTRMEIPQAAYRAEVSSRLVAYHQCSHLFVFLEGFRRCYIEEIVQVAHS